jgi:OmpA-like transmembrane domain
MFDQTHGPRPFKSPLLRAALAALLVSPLLVTPARALDLVGFYVGAGIGQGQLSTGAPGYSSQDFRENHSAYGAFVGVRPISLLGAEVAYLNLGHPDGTLAGLGADAKIDGTAGFALFYLPLPVPFLDLYAKAGVARLTSSLHGSLPVVGPFRAESTDTRPAGGVGAELGFGSLAVRAEYTRFDVAGGTPGLFMVSLTKTLF